MGNLRSSFTPSSQAGPTLGSHLSSPSLYLGSTHSRTRSALPTPRLGQPLGTEAFVARVALPPAPTSQGQGAGVARELLFRRSPATETLKQPQGSQAFFLFHASLCPAAFSDSPSTHPSGEQQQVSRQAPRPRGSCRREWGSRVSCGAGDQESRPGRIAGGQDASQEKAVRYFCHQALRGTLDKRELRAPRVFGGISVGSAGKLGRPGRPRPAPRKRAAKK